MAARKAAHDMTSNVQCPNTTGQGPGPLFHVRRPQEQGTHARACAPRQSSRGLETGSYSPPRARSRGLTQMQSRSPASQQRPPTHHTPHQVTSHLFPWPFRRHPPDADAAGSGRRRALFGLWLCERACRPGTRAWCVLAYVNRWRTCTVALSTWAARACDLLGGFTGAHRD